MEKILLKSDYDLRVFCKKYDADSPRSFPCVAVIYEVDVDPYPVYFNIEYVYPSDFAAD